MKTPALVEIASFINRAPANTVARVHPAFPLHGHFKAVVILWIATLLGVLLPKAIGQDSPESRLAIQERLLTEQSKRLGEMQGRLTEARQALVTARAQANNSHDEAAVYFEASRRIADVGIILGDGNEWNLPAPGIPHTSFEGIQNIDAIKLGQYATAAAAVDRLKRGMDSYRKYEEFALADASGETQKPLEALQEKIKRCSVTNQKLKTERDATKQLVDTRAQLKGVWRHAASGKQISITLDGNITFNGKPGVVGTWLLNGNAVAIQFNGRKSDWTLSGNSLLGAKLSYTKQ